MYLYPETSPALDLPVIYCNGLLLLPGGGGDGGGGGEKAHLMFAKVNHTNM